MNIHEEAEEYETGMLIRALVSKLWAEGWDSDEDAAYDDEGLDDEHP